ncbi:16325_t:CDS:10, partial [Gigaspora rosea]
IQNNEKYPPTFGAPVININGYNAEKWKIYNEKILEGKRQTKIDLDWAEIKAINNMIKQAIPESMFSEISKLRKIYDFTVIIIENKNINLVKFLVKIRDLNITLNYLQAIEAGVENDIFIPSDDIKWTEQKCERSVDETILENTKELKLLTLRSENILVDERFVLKISGFNLSVTKPELNFGNRAGVYFYFQISNSYGLVAWEIATDGIAIYPNIKDAVGLLEVKTRDNIDDLIEILKLNDTPDPLKYVIKECCKFNPHELITLDDGQKLGKGSRGETVLGEYKGVNVVAKCIFQENGNLLDYLANNVCNWNTKIKMAIDIANGLLECHKHGIIHSDLKADNILVDERLVLKISGFDLSITKVEMEFGNKAGALLSGGHLNVLLMTSDLNGIEIIQAFCMEIATNGMRLYSNIKDGVELLEVKTRDDIDDLVVILKLKDTPTLLKHVVKQCCKFDPNNRISLEEVVFELLNKFQNL